MSHRRRLEKSNAVFMELTTGLSITLSVSDQLITTDVPLTIHFHIREIRKRIIVWQFPDLEQGRAGTIAICHFPRHDQGQCFPKSRSVGLHPGLCASNKLVIASSLCLDVGVGVQPQKYIIGKHKSQIESMKGS